MSGALAGRCVLVTGASSGIGHAVAAEVARQGAAAVVHYRSQRQSALDLVESITRSGGRAVALGADVAVEDDVERLFSEIDRFGKLDGLVANAGIWTEPSVPLTEMSHRQWRHTLDVNLDGAFFSCRGFLQRLPDDGPASAVLVGSTAALFGEEGHADYAASKSALVGLMLSLKNEIVRRNPLARINLVHPGWVATPMAAAALENEGVVARTTATMALRKIAKPEDVAQLVVFLLADSLSGHLTGLSLPVAGGMEGRLLHDPNAL